MSGRIDLKSVRLKTAQKYSNWLLFYLFFQKQAPFSVPSSPYRGQKPSLPLRKAPPLISVFFNGLYTPFGSPVSGGQKPQGRRGKPLLLVARNRYALRLAGHQSPRQIVRDGTALLILACSLRLLACGCYLPAADATYLRLAATCLLIADWLLISLQNGLWVNLFVGLLVSY